MPKDPQTDLKASLVEKGTAGLNSVFKTAKATALATTFQVLLLPTCLADLHLELQLTCRALSTRISLTCRALSTRISFTEQARLATTGT